jgi:molybdate transport system ATP-binding protein
MLEVSVSHRYASGFDLDVAFTAERTTVLFGPSGSGKSSLLAAVAGLLRPDAGRIAMNGECWMGDGRWMPVHRRRLGLVFQDARLFPHLSVRGNLRYGAARAPGDAPGPAEAEVLDLLGIGHLLDRKPAGLSGGERQRVALGRALLARPRLLLMDEPLASLDAARRGEVMRLIEEVRGRFRLPILYVTHALDEVDCLAERVVLLEDGRLVASGTPEELALRTDLPLAMRRDAGVLLRCRVAAHDAARGTTCLELPAGMLDVPLRAEAIGQELRLRLRARDVAVTTEPGAVPLGHAAIPVEVVRLDAVQPGEALVTLGTGAMRLLARLPREAAQHLRPGQAVRALISRTALDHGAGG